MSNKKAVPIYFNPDEVCALALGLGRVIDDIKEVGQNQTIPWSPEARAAQREILTAARSAGAKLEKFTGVRVELPKYETGDENEFFTKPS
jgi:hypothetical protein